MAASKNISCKQLTCCCDLISLDRGKQLDMFTHELMRQCSSMAEGTGHFFRCPLSGRGVLHNIHSIGFGDVNFTLGKKLTDVCSRHIALLLGGGDGFEAP